MRNTLCEYYKKLFNAENQNRNIDLSSVLFPSHSDEEQNALISPITDDEIKAALFSIKENKLWDLMVLIGLSLKLLGTVLKMIFALE